MLIILNTVFWYFLISLKATVPGRYLCGFFTPPDKGADFLAALEARCLRGALAPVDFLAVYFVLAIWIPKICKFYKKNYWYLGKKKIIVFKYTYTKKNYFF